jgi:hypothetical protein
MVIFFFFFFFFFIPYQPKIPIHREAPDPDHLHAKAIPEPARVRPEIHIRRHGWRLMWIPAWNLKLDLGDGQGRVEYRTWRLCLVPGWLVAEFESLRVGVNGSGKSLCGVLELCLKKKKTNIAFAARPAPFTGRLSSGVTRNRLRHRRTSQKLISCIDVACTNSLDMESDSLAPRSCARDGA